MTQFKIWQEYSEIVANLASTCNIPANQIVFDAKCTPISLNVIIKSNDESALSKFFKSVQKYCIE